MSDGVWLGGASGRDERTLDRCVAGPRRLRPTDSDSDVAVGFPHAAALFSIFPAVVNDKLLQKALSGSRIKKSSFQVPNISISRAKKIGNMLDFFPPPTCGSKDNWDRPLGDFMHLSKPTPEKEKRRVPRVERAARPWFPAARRKHLAQRASSSKTSRTLASAKEAALAGRCPTRAASDHGRAARSTRDSAVLLPKKMPALPGARRRISASPPRTSRGRRGNS